MGDLRESARGAGRMAVEVIAHLRLSLWLAALGAIVLYAFFVAIATVPPQQIAKVTAAMAAVAALIAIRQLRLDNELASPGGDPALRRACNRQRERRGF